VPAAQAAPHTYSLAGQTISAPNYQAKVAVWAALAQRGKPYVWGGDGPRSYDCSGLVQYAMRRVGVSLPHSSRMQSQMGRPVSKGNLRPGDLVFFYRPVSHVAMYVGAGRIVHAPTRGSVVHVTLLKYMPGYAGARRMI
jgi:cell wall-associated NlpC family hydrolase